MPIVKKARSRGQGALHWKRLSDDRSGSGRYAEPVALEVRWEDTIQEIVTIEGETETSASMVFVPDGPLRGDYLQLIDGKQWSAKRRYKVGVVVWAGLHVYISTAEIPAGQAQPVHGAGTVDSWEWQSTASARPRRPYAWEVKKVSRIPSLKNTETLILAYL